VFATGDRSEVAQLLKVHASEGSRGAGPLMASPPELALYVVLTRLLRRRLRPVGPPPKTGK